MRPMPMPISPGTRPQKRGSRPRIKGTAPPLEGGRPVGAQRGAKQPRTAPHDGLHRPVRCEGDLRLAITSRLDYLSIPFPVRLATAALAMGGITGGWRDAP